VSDRVFVYTFKEGLLSRVAHDLRLHVEPRGLTITREQDRVRAEIRVDALVVDGAMTKGALDIDALSRRDRAKIVETIQTEILDARRQPQIRFEGRVEGEDPLAVTGELELAGVRRPLSFTLARAAGRLSARVSVRPSEFGVAPYKALAGAIRLQDRVLVELDLDER
jgi:polyisoprenoid-binding protein YceI